jgi:2'-5' RNA ligase
MAETLSALLVTLPDADHAIRTWREIHDPSGRRGLPAHVTILVPFVPPRDLDDDVLDAVGRILGEIPAFDLALRKTARFFDTLYLAPEPDAPLRAMTRALVARWPQCPPYGGAYPDPTPHVTVAHNRSEEVFAQVEAQVAEVLPIKTRVTQARLYVGSNDTGWEDVAGFPLSPV